MSSKVLFIGNSHTYLHYMPQMLAQLVKAQGRGLDLAVDQCTGEGASLEWHWHNESSRLKMRSRKWDYIVLQDRSGGPLEDLASFRKHARLLHGEIQRLGAQTVFYLTWANLNRPDTQSLLSEAYSGIAAETGALLAPVGLAWKNALETSSELVLHHKDGRHASPTGAYLAACVFYSVLANASPEGLPASFFIEGKYRPELEQATAELLQKVAWKTVLDAEAGQYHC